MIEEMRGGEREQDEARSEPQPLQEIAAGEDVHGFGFKPGSAQTS